MPRPRFTHGERTPGTHCTGGWVGPRSGLDTEARGKTLCPCRGSNPNRPVVQPVVRHYTAWANTYIFKCWCVRRSFCVLLFTTTGYLCTRYVCRFCHVLQQTKTYQMLLIPLTMFPFLLIAFRSSHISVSKVTGYLLDDRASNLGMDRDSFHPRVQIGSSNHPAFCPVGTEGKAVAAWSWPFTSIYCRG
jgi:hypothetical protein